MKTKMILALILLFCLPQALWALTGREIMDQSKKLPTPKTAESDITMSIYKGRQKEDKTFTTYAKQYSQDEARILVSFHQPTRIQLLTHVFRGREDDQWITLSTGRVKRVVSSDKGKPFVHSHFYFEDLGSRNIDDYDYKYSGDAKAVGAECYVVESVKKNDREKIYDKMVLYVRKADYFVVRIDFYQKGHLHKYLENHDLRNTQGFLTPYHVVMTLADGREKTELKVEKVAYNITIRDSRFSKETLR